MEQDDPKRDDDAQDALDTQAILARRRAFVASALAGMTLSTASCETDVSGSVSVQGQVTTSGNSSQNTGQNNGTVTQGGTVVQGDTTAQSGNNIVQPQVCLMVAYAEPQSPDASSMDASYTLVSPQPCLEMAVPQPCLSRPAPCLMVVAMDAGNPGQSDASTDARRDARTDARADARASNVGNIGIPAACLRYAAPRPQPCLDMVEPMPQPCLTPVRKDTPEE
ncbi:MAG: hypothetical protein Q8Q09_01385 [Deltaproteobacteria bacterium]|nr:hypothetical protein [Deltaproteobacteria bacterium]